MSTYKIGGYKFVSQMDGGIERMDVASLEFVAPQGSAVLGFDYISPDAESAEVSLADYNIVLNGTHINDGVLPERIEVFSLEAPGSNSGMTAHVFNVGYDSEGATVDFVFSVGGANLPELNDVAAANSFFEDATMQRLTGTEMPDGYAINLLDMPGVEIGGILGDLLRAESGNSDQSEEFMFADHSQQEVDSYTELSEMETGFGHSGAADGALLDALEDLASQPLVSDVDDLGF